jgi:alcohol dehydrogenase class IV
MGVTGTDDEVLADAAVVAVANLFDVIGIPQNLIALGVMEDQLDWIAGQSMLAARLVTNNPRPLDVAIVRSVVQASFIGDRPWAASQHA